MSKPLVGIIMGSDSDLPVMKDAEVVLEELGIGSEVHVLSAHRTPEAVITYVHDAEQRGFKVLICSAGMAAHLAGVVAARTSLPVIGVPISSKNTSGIDALFSTVQMPPGVPVATVAINGAKNAGVLAAQIIGTEDLDVRKSVTLYKEKLGKDVLAKDQKLQKKGFKKYLEENGMI